MRITFTPMRREDRLTLARVGDTLIVNGEALDFGPLTEGAVLPRAAVDCPWLASDVTRTRGQVRLALILPHGINAPHDTLFPQPVVVKTDGPIAVPPAERARTEPVLAPVAARGARYGQD